MRPDGSSHYVRLGCELEREIDGSTIGERTSCGRGQFGNRGDVSRHALAGSWALTRSDVVAEPGS